MRALYEENNDYICKKSTNTTSTEHSSTSKHDHRKDIDEHLTIYIYIYIYNMLMISLITDKSKIDLIKKAVRSKLETRNLHVNKMKSSKMEMNHGKNVNY